jgi:hypothetical protein
MRIQILSVVFALLWLCGSTNMQAQSKTSPAGQVASAKKVSKAASKPSPDSDIRAKRFWLFASLSTGFDSNINQDPDGTPSFGLVSSMGFHFQDNAEKPSFEIEYEAGLHHYTNTDKWNRVSHSAATSYKRHLFGRWYTRTTGELSLRGSSEDRELNNQYLLGQQLEYRPTANTRLIGFAAYRLKRDPVEEGKNAIDPYIGAKFVQRLRGERRWEISYRYDHNRSWDPRNRYVRWTYGARFETPLLQHDRLTFEGSYRPQMYARTVKVDDVRVTRHDARWSFNAVWDHPLSERMTMRMFYRFEKRLSNSADKRYTEQLPGVSLTYQW